MFLFKIRPKGCVKKHKQYLMQFKSCAFLYTDAPDLCVIVCMITLLEVADVYLFILVVKSPCLQRC